MSGPTLPAASPSVRAAAAACAFAATGLVVTTMLGLFHQASPKHWLAPTPELMELAAACQALPGREPRLDCTRAVIAAYGERLARARVLAQAAP